MTLLPHCPATGAPGPVRPEGLAHGGVPGHGTLEALDVVVRQRACAAPEAPAVVTAAPAAPGIDVLTYGELAGAAARAAAGLSAHSVRSGDTVGVVGDCGPEQVVAMLAVLAVGARVLPLPPERPGQAELHAIEGLGMIAELRWGSPDRGPLGTAPVLSLSDLIRTPPTDAPPPVDLPALLDRAGYACLTSGTGSRPRALRHSHAALVQLGGWLAGHLGLGPGDRVGQWSLPGYDAQLVETVAALLGGAALCPVPAAARLDPAAVLDWLERHEVTWFQTVPSFAWALVAEARTAPRRSLALRSVALAGEPLTGELVHALRDVLGVGEVLNLYGSSETILATYHDVPEDVADGLVPVGRAIAGREVLVVDARGRACVEDQVGEVVVRTPFVADGLGGPAGPRSRARSYRTGDHGAWSGGVLWFRGRGDDVVKVAGRRVRLSQVEAVVGGVAGVADCVVVPRVDPSGLVIQLVAHVAPATVPHRAIRAALGEHLGASPPPVRIRSVDGLPRGRGGKLDRAALRDPEPRSVTDRPPRPTDHVRADRSTS